MIQTCEVKDYVAVEKLKFHPKNKELRTITRDRLEDLKNSITKNGFYEPILVWKKGNVVLAGEHRVRAVKELISEGYTLVNSAGKKNHLPVVFEDCDEETAIKILHQSNAHYAQWIEEKLAEAMAAAKQVGMDPKEFGYSNEEIDKMLVLAVKDAEASQEDLSDAEKAGEKVKDEKLPKVKERHNTLVLSETAYGEISAILSSIAKKLNKDWKNGDSFELAVQVLCQAVRESGIIEEIDLERKKEKKE